MSRPRGPVRKYKAHIINKLVFLALLDISIQPEMRAELQGLHNSKSGSVDVILLHIAHHTSQGCLGLGATIQLLFSSCPTP